MRQIILSFLALITISGTAFSSDQDGVTPYDWNVSVVPYLGFRLEYPKSWTITDDGRSSHQFRITSPDYASCGINKISNVMGGFAEVKKNDPFRNNIMQTRLKNLTVLQNQETRWGGEDALIYTYRYLFNNAGVSFMAVSIQISTISHKSYWVGTCSTSEDDFPKHQKLFTAILSTFQILN